MVTSSWQTRMSKSLLHCFKFRYLVYGPDAHRLEIFHKYRGENRESRIWTASHDDTDVWRYGQVPVGALGEFQVNRSKLDREQSFINGHWQIPKTQHDVKSKRGTPRYDAGYTGYQDDLAELCLRREKQWSRYYGCVGWMSVPTTKSVAWRINLRYKTCVFLGFLFSPWLSTWVRDQGLTIKETFVA